MHRVLDFGSRFTLLITLIALTAVSGLTQNREKFIISAKAGGVNSVSGYVTVLDHLTGVQRALNSRDNLEHGDVVMTGSEGRVEVLLNPGTYLRVAENSEFSFDDTSLEKLSLGLTKGTAIVEATGDDNVELFATINTPQTKISILKRGIYRINVLASNTTEVVVHKGRAILNDDQAKLVKESSPDPRYPEEARKKGLQGVVKLHVLVAKDGSVKKLSVISGDPILAKSSLDTVRRWKYQPTLSNGKPVEVESVVEITFTIYP